MRLTRLQRLLDIHGADLARWPAALRIRAARRLAADPAARAAQDAAARLERALDRLPAVPATDHDARLARLMRRLPPQSRPRPWSAPLALWDLLPAWPRGVALAGMAALGILVGLTDLDGVSAEARARAAADVSGLIFDPNPAIGLGQ